MKIISLNIWGGAVRDELLAYIKEQAPTTDIFCFQEVYSSAVDMPRQSEGEVMNIFELISQALPDFAGSFEPTQNGVGIESEIPMDVTLGNASFVRKEFKFEHGFVFMYGSLNSMTPGDRYTIPTGFQYLRTEYGGKPLTICNTYGNPRPGSKLDTPERINQSATILEFISKEKGSVVVCGDLNLMPETESIRMLSEKLSDLIHEYKITNTRSKVNYEKYHHEEIQHFADYTFVSKDIKVKSFSVPQIEISDHLPMVLEF